MNIINENRLIMDRVKALKKRRYTLIQCPLPKGRACVGIIHDYAHSTRMQIGSPKGYLRYAWVVMFSPMPYDKVHELNLKTFGGTL